MTCYYPRYAYQLESGKWKAVSEAAIEISGGDNITPVRVPCGCCTGCRLDYARDWVVRCHHEALIHEEKCFITLTYNNKNLPKDRSVSKRELQLFIKRLRRKIEPKEISFYGCGEYGDRLSRPHYHCLIFGHDFSDKEPYQDGSKRTGRLRLRDSRRFSCYTSKELEKIWKKGFVTVGELTLESAGYVARYCTKKITGIKAEEHYNGREPEFALMSRRPAIGKRFMEKYKYDVFPKDFCTIDGKKFKPPRYYDKLYMRRCADSQWENYEKLKNDRKEKAKDESLDRLMDKRKHKKQIIKPLIRRMENGKE